MTEPEAPPPPSSSPPTAREAPAHRRREGGLDPYPPNPGLVALSRPWWPHAVLVLELAAVAALARGSVMLLVLPALLVVAAWQAWLLARVDARHRPLAIGFGAWAALQLLARALDVTVLAEPGPYTGWARVAFHIEEATRLAAAALPAWMAMAALYPQGPSRRRALRLGAWLVWPGAWLVLVVRYPALRGDDLRRVYLVAELAALIVALGAFVSWARRHGWRSVCDACVGVFGEGHVEPPCKHAGARWYTWAPILALVAGDLLLLGFGAWRWGLFGDAYLVQQGGLLAVWGVVVALQGAALVMARGRA